MQKLPVKMWDYMLVGGGFSLLMAAVSPSTVLLNAASVAPVFPGGYVTISYLEYARKLPYGTHRS